MREKNDTKKSRSLRTLVIYGAFVFALILLSFAVRVFYLIEQSKFDGQHRFTLVIGQDLPAGRQASLSGRQESSVMGLISFEPVTSSLSLLVFPKNFNLSFSNLNRKFGVIPDGYIKSRNNLSLRDTIPSMLQSFLFHPNGISTNINFYDLSRLYLYANKVPVGSVKVEDVSISSDDRDFNRDASLLLTDNAISTENVSVQIVNAAGQSGLGSRLERVISNLGGNVVSVKTALVIEPVSKIRYYGRETYTLKKLERLLRIKKEALDKEDIAEIVIIIGEDNKDTSLF